MVATCTVKLQILDMLFMMIDGSVLVSASEGHDLIGLLNRRRRKPRSASHSKSCVHAIRLYEQRVTSSLTTFNALEVLRTYGVEMHSVVAEGQDAPRCAKTDAALPRCQENWLASVTSSVEVHRFLPKMTDCYDIPSIR